MSALNIAAAKLVNNHQNKATFWKKSIIDIFFHVLRYSIDGLLVIESLMVIGLSS